MTAANGTLPGAVACRWCPSPIVWAVTRNRKRIPLDPEPNPSGNVEVTLGRPPFANVHAGPPGMFDKWVAYMPHHATCEGVNR